MIKKMIMAVVAAVMMSTSVMAQDNNVENRRGPRMDMKEMVKNRTDETVKRYGLNEEQAAKLLELNTKFADKMGPRRGQRPGGGRGFAPDSTRRMGMAQDSARERKRPEGNMERRPDRPMGQPGMMPQRDEWRKTMEEYDNELKTIMTEEQFKAYKEDSEKRMRERPRRGQRIQ